MSETRINQLRTQVDQAGQNDKAAFALAVRDPSYAGHPTPLRVFRAAQGLSQGSLADSAGVSRNTISRLERGCNVPTRTTRSRLARALGLDELMLFPLNDERRPSEAGAVKEPRRQARHDAG